MEPLLEEWGPLLVEQLREQLNNLTAAAQLLTPVVQESGEERHRQYLAILNQSVYRMTRTLNNAEYAQLPEGEPALRRAPLDLAGLCRELERQVTPLAALAGVQFSYEEERACLLTVGDAALLRRMLLNLIANALGRRGAGGQAGLRLADAGRRRCSPCGTTVPAAAVRGRARRRKPAPQAGRPGARAEHRPACRIPPRRRAGFGTAGGARPALGGLPAGYARRSGIRCSKRPKWAATPPAVFPRYWWNCPVCCPTRPFCRRTWNRRAYQRLLEKSRRVLHRWRETAFHSLPPRRARTEEGANAPQWFRWSQACAGRLVPRMLSLPVPEMAWGGA